MDDQILDIAIKHYTPKGRKLMQPSVEREPVNWEITAIGLRCDYIDDFVTVRVYRDWVTKCTWYLKYKFTTSKGNKLKLEKRIKGRIDKCVGPDCPVVTKYRDKLIEEESGKR